MRISELSWPVLLLGAPLLMADVATFTGNESRLTGSLQSIDGEGIIEWSSPFSSRPLKLRSEKLQQVTFPEDGAPAAPAPIMITLRNGDQLPVLAVNELAGAGLRAETRVAGAVTIPRDALSSAQFGIRSEKVVYSGPQSIREWSAGKGEPGNWRQRGKSLVSSGQSIAARDCDLPRNFILKFGLEWDTRSTNFLVTFADPLDTKSNRQDFYSFQFNNSGIRIVRHLKSDGSQRTLAQWPRRPGQSPGKMEVELRVNRDNQRLELILDGESEGLILDAPGEVPAASGVSFRCQTQAGGTQTVRDIVISELNDTRSRHLAEERGDAGSDSLITADDDRWSGELLAIRGNAATPSMLFKTSFADKAWEIPQREISTLFFAEYKREPDPGPAEAGFILQFHGSGQIRVSNCLIDADEVRATHPLVGPLSLQRKTIKLIRRADGR